MKDFKFTTTDITNEQWAAVVARTEYGIDVTNDYWRARMDELCLYSEQHIRENAELDWVWFHAKLLETVRCPRYAPMKVKRPTLELLVDEGLIDRYVQLKDYWDFCQAQ